MVDWFGDGSVVVAELGLACCAVEFAAAARTRSRLTDIPETARRVLVVSGTVTHNLADRVVQAAENLNATHVVAFGACASAGGPYWDSPVVTTVPELLDVAACIPGCAPTPEALNKALETLR
ncbi:MAG: proton-conducting membrane transporter [Propionibacteriaceae bacterium]